MPLTNCREIVARAQREGWAVAQINTNGGNYELSRAILEAAQELHSPIILGCYETNAKWMGLDHIGASLTRMADQFAPSIPVVLHLDHGSSLEVVARAILARFTSVMYDGSKESIERNIEITGRVAEMAHALGLTVEAELGRLVEGQGDPEDPNLVSLDDVRALTGAVQLDLLAIAIGNAHGFYKGEPKINVDRVREVRAITDVPLVLHGTTGIPADTVRACIAAGMAKVNYGTQLRYQHIEFTREAIETVEHGGHPWWIQTIVKDRLKEEVKKILRLVGSEGKAR